MHCRLAKCLVVMLLVTVTGGHWALLQTAAWVGMTIDYSQDHGLKVALKNTFDGKHPCQLCKLISKEKKSEQKKAMQKFETKLELILDLTALVLYPPPFNNPVSPGLSLDSCVQSPPAPPPRSLHL